jgi:hypothetical protein
LKSPFRIEESADGKIITVLVDMNAIPVKVKPSEADALHQVLAELKGDRASSPASSALEYIVSAEGVRQLLEAAAAAKNLSEDLRAALHLQWTVGGHRIREAMDDDRSLADALRRILPSYEGPALTILPWRICGTVRHRPDRVQLVSRSRGGQDVC